MKSTDFQVIWSFESMIFKAKHFFLEQSLHKTVHKLRGTSITLGHAGSKKISLNNDGTILAKK